MRRIIALSTLVAMCLLPPAAVAQAGASAVVGLVAQGATGVAGIPIDIAGPVERRAVTDADGRFRFEGLPDGAYTLTPHHDAYTFAPTTLTLTLPGETTPIFDAQPAMPTAREAEESALPVRLVSAYPIPFREGTTVTYTVTQAGDVALDVIDMLGRRVRILATGPHAVGVHERRFEAGALPRGWYLIRLWAHSEDGVRQDTHRVLLLR